MTAYKNRAKTYTFCAKIFDQHISEGFDRALVFFLAARVLCEPVFCISGATSLLVGFPVQGLCPGEGAGVLTEGY